MDTVYFKQEWTVFFCCLLQFFQTPIQTDMRGKLKYCNLLWIKTLKMNYCTCTNKKKILLNLMRSWLFYSIINDIKIQQIITRILTCFFLYIYLNNIPFRKEIHGYLISWIVLWIAWLCVRKLKVFITIKDVSYVRF